ncbi:hypothetical protein, unlikely [Trypanosoma congolense IL3000]|uniref:Uncharacterized protein n=1 Tax=Trypanosoma congolense (strain IL3000) TaxID=1068625 RepID=F9W8D5_TRYCI|nr:hypothetical protein, unlikely [Trypanosoma congolense IL3000]
MLGATKGGLWPWGQLRGNEMAHLNHVAFLFCWIVGGCLSFNTHAIYGGQGVRAGGGGVWRCCVSGRGLTSAVVVMVIYPNCLTVRMTRWRDVKALLTCTECDGGSWPGRANGISLTTGVLPRVAGYWELV